MAKEQSIEIEAKCDLCKEALDVYFIFGLGKWSFHPECYQIVIERLNAFVEVLFWSEDKWQEWLNDDSL